MNRLIIIGNGFDLAHGLKTKYSDFILWYLNRSLNEALSKGFYSDDFMVITNHSHNVTITEDIKSFVDLERFKLKYPMINIDLPDRFFESLLKKMGSANWVDVEYEYYRNLVKIIKIINESDKVFLIEILNSSFDRIKKTFQDYLRNISLKINLDDTIIKHFEKIIDTKGKPSSTDFHILNFNYTSSIDNYMRYFGLPIDRVINIHGKLDDVDYPIIFGYGDEMDENYKLIESHNNNTFLDHFKSFGYVRNDYYRKLMSFIESSKYYVYIMGHSCGISDRVLLNTIFANEHCSKILLFYHKVSETENDYSVKVQEISRHFPPELKNRMRKIIEPFNLSTSLT